MITKYLIFIVLALSANSGFAAKVAKVRNEDLRRLIAFSEVLAERKISDMYRVRFFVDSHYGDCGHPGPSCPREKLYMAIVFGELPGDDVYFLGTSYGWKFIEWKSFPENNPFEEVPVEAILEKLEGRDGVFLRTRVLIRVDDGKEVSIK